MNAQVCHLEDRMVSTRTRGQDPLAQGPGAESVGSFPPIDSIRSVQSVKVELKSIIIIDKTREDAPNRRKFFNVPENRQVQSQRNIKNWNISQKLNKRSKDGLQYSRISNHLAGTVSLIGQGSRPSLFAYPLPRSKLSLASKPISTMTSFSQLQLSK